MAAWTEDGHLGFRSQCVMKPVKEITKPLDIVLALLLYCIPCYAIDSAPKGIAAGRAGTEFVVAHTCGLHSLPHELSKRHARDATVELREGFLADPPTYTSSQGSMSFDSRSKSIIDPNGHFIHRRFEVGMPIEIRGSTSNDGQRTIVAITDTSIRLQEPIADEAMGKVVRVAFIIPRGVSLKIHKGASVVVPAGRTLFITGPFEAGLYQCFVGDGCVEFGGHSVKEVSPEWFGISGKNDEMAIQKALKTAQKARLPVALSGTYRTGGPVILPYYAVVSCYGTRLVAEHRKAALVFRSNAKISGKMEINGKGMASSGIQCATQIASSYSSYAHFDNITIHDCAVGLDMLKEAGCGDHGGHFNRFEYLYIYRCDTGIRFLITGAAAGYINGNSFGTVVVERCKSGVVIDGANETTFQFLGLECNGLDGGGWGLELVHARGFIVLGGWMEGNGGSPAGRNIRMANHPDVRSVDISAMIENYHKSIDNHAESNRANTINSN